MSTEADALSHVAGYCVVNDLSERAYQLEGTGQWVKGKSADTFGPIGPWLVTADEVPDCQNLDLWLEVDGHRYQNGIDGDDGLRRAVPRQLSQPLHEPAAGRHHHDRHAARRRPRHRSRRCYLRAGNVMRLGVDGLGEQRQQVVDHRSAEHGRTEVALRDAPVPARSTSRSASSAAIGADAAGRPRSLQLRRHRGAAAAAGGGRVSADDRRGRRAACSWPPRSRMPIVTRGSGTGLSGGSVPDAGSLVLCLDADERDPRRRSAQPHAARAGRRDHAGASTRRRPGTGCSIRRIRARCASAPSAATSPRTPAGCAA